MNTIGARDRRPATPGAVPLGVTTVLVAALLAAGLLMAGLVRPWLELREIEARPAVVPEHVRPASPEQVVPEQVVPNQVVPNPARGRPVRVRIEAIGVDAEVVPVGLGEDGELVPPGDVDQVGWWRDGAEAGSPRGAVVLAGHSVSMGDGVFDDLGRLEAGDTVTVRTERGVVGYVVGQVVDYSHEHLALLAPDLFGADVSSRLTLVTCSGFVAGTYHANTVVTAHPRASAP